MPARRITPLRPKRTRPETPGQARTWDRNAARYRAAGFCEHDTARAAWGHQIGFANVDPVGDCCRGLVLPDGAGERVARWAGSAATVSDREGSDAA